MVEGAIYRDGTAGLRSNKVAVIDGSYMLHRALRMREAMSPNEDGQMIGGVFLCLRSLVSVMKNVSPGRVFWTFDSSRDPVRLQMFPEYKEKIYADDDKRIEEEHYREVYAGQRDLLVPFLNQFGVHVLLGPYEADDTIYYLREIVQWGGLHLVICSDDHDFVQLVDHTTTIYSPHHQREFLLKDIGDLSTWLPNELVLAKGILGDKSDNIPSPCKGLGKVGLRKLFDKMTEVSLSDAVAKSDGMGKKYETLKDPEVQAQVIRNIQLTQLGFVQFNEAQQAWLEAEWLTTRTFDIYTAMAAIQQYDFKSFLDSVGSWCRYFEGIS